MRSISNKGLSRRDDQNCGSRRSRGRGSACLTGIPARYANLLSKPFHKYRRVLWNNLSLTLMAPIRAARVSKRISIR
jgi:hypothetical protein